MPKRLKNRSAHPGSSVSSPSALTLFRVFPTRSDPRSTAITTSAPSRGTAIPARVHPPPSTSRRPSILTGVSSPGRRSKPALHRIRYLRAATPRPLRRSVATQANGIPVPKIAVGEFSLEEIHQAVTTDHPLRKLMSMSETTLFHLSEPTQVLSLSRSPAAAAAPTKAPIEQPPDHVRLHALLGKRLDHAQVRPPSVQTHSPEQVRFAGGCREDSTQHAPSDAPRRPARREVMHRSP